MSGKITTQLPNTIDKVLFNPILSATKPVQKAPTTEVKRMPIKSIDFIPSEAPKTLSTYIGKLFWEVTIASLKKKYASRNKPMPGDFIRSLN
jgi:hypothetical protein